MLGGRHLPGTQEASGSEKPRSGGLNWWQRRSWRMDLAVLSRVRDGLKRLDAELDFDRSTRFPSADLAGTADPDVAGTTDKDPSARPLDAEAGTSAPAPADPPAQDAPASVLPDAAIMSIRETFSIVAAAGEEPASYFYARLFVAHPQLRDMFPAAMDAQRDRLLRALVRIASVRIVSRVATFPNCPRRNSFITDW